MPPCLMIVTRILHEWTCPIVKCDLESLAFSRSPNAQYSIILPCTVQFGGVPRNMPSSHRRFDTSDPGFVQRTYKFVPWAAFLALVGISACERRAPSLKYAAAADWEASRPRPLRSEQSHVR